MFLRAGLEYADDRVTLRCVKVYIPAEQEQELNKRKTSIKKISNVYSVPCVLYLPPRVSQARNAANDDGMKKTHKLAKRLWKHEIMIKT